MFEFLYTILLLRALVFMFSKDATTPKGFSYVMLGIAILMGLLILGTLTTLFNALQAGDSPETSEIWAALAGSIVLSIVAYVLYQAYLILSKTAPDKFETIQEFQVFQAILRGFNIVFAIVMIFAIINVIMMFVFLVGIFIYLALVIGTIGLILLNKGFKFDDFIYVPNQFFKAEEAYFKWVGIDVGIVILFCSLIIFLVPTVLAIWVIMKKQKLLQ
jgi:hypothetical protein